MVMSSLENGCQTYRSFPLRFTGYGNDTRRKTEEVEKSLYERFQFVYTIRCWLCGVCAQTHKFIFPEITPFLKKERNKKTQTATKKKLNVSERRKGEKSEK